MAGGAGPRITEATMTVGVPLVGAQVEEAVGAGLREHAAAEAEVVPAWLDHG